MIAPIERASVTDAMNETAMNDSTVAPDATPGPRPADMPVVDAAADAALQPDISQSDVSQPDVETEEIPDGIPSEPIYNPFAEENAPETLEIDGVTYWRTAMSEGVARTPDTPVWTLRQFKDAAKIVAKILPAVVPFLRTNNSGGDNGAIPLTALLDALEYVVPLLDDEELLYQLVAVVYVADGAAFNKAYPMEEHMTQLSGAPVEALGGAVWSFLPFIRKSIAGASPTSSRKTAAQTTGR